MANDSLFLPVDSPTIGNVMKLRLKWNSCNISRRFAKRDFGTLGFVIEKVQTIGKLTECLPLLYLRDSFYKICAPPILLGDFLVAYELFWANIPFLLEIIFSQLLLPNSGFFQIFSGSRIFLKLFS